jgi:glycosyltransferase involved in cell wall biosynthesis
MKNMNKPIAKISICIPCMNRTDDLKRTLIRSIEANKGYPNFEVILLNYNSSDDLHKYIQSNKMRYYLKLGIVKYYITRTPKFYNPTYAKNLAASLSSGSILVHANCDSIIPVGFCDYTNSYLSSTQKSFLLSDDACSCGKIAIKKDDFLSIGGYDEELSDYGYTNESLIKKLKYSGYVEAFWVNEFKRSLPTLKEKRAENMREKDWSASKLKNVQITLKKIKTQSFSTEFVTKAPADLYRFIPT